MSGRLHWAPRALELSVTPGLTLALESLTLGAFELEAWAQIFRHASEARGIPSELRATYLELSAELHHLVNEKLTAPADSEKDLSVRVSLRRIEVSHG